MMAADLSDDECGNDARHDACIDGCNAGGFDDMIEGGKDLNDSGFGEGVSKLEGWTLEGSVRSVNAWKRLEG